MKENNRSKLIKKARESAAQALNREIEEEKGPYWDSFQESSDRGFAIIVGCILDDELQEILTKFFIKDKKVKNLFSNQNLLMHANSKIQLAYFLGIIPKIVYEDLIRINTIRNKFAHNFHASLEFNDEAILGILKGCNFAYDPLPGEVSGRLQFILCITQLYGLLKIVKHLLTSHPTGFFIDAFNLKDIPAEELRLTEAELLKLKDDFISKRGKANFAGKSGK